MNATIPTVAASRSGITHSVATDGNTACGFTVRYGRGWDGLADTAPVTCLRCSHLPAEAPARVAAADAPRDEVTAFVVELPLADPGAGESCCAMCRYYTGHTSWCPNRPGGAADIHDQVAADVAAEKDEADALSAVTGDEDLDVMQCDLFGHEPEGGRCEVCGEPDPAVAAVLADAAAHGGTLHSEPGGFGAALGAFGFGEGQRGDSMSEGVYWAFDHATAAVRVVCYTDDGNRVALIGYDPERRAARLVAWKASFDGSTPQHVVLTALAAALGFPSAG